MLIRVKIILIPNEPVRLWAGCVFDYNSADICQTFFRGYKLTLAVNKAERSEAMARIRRGAFPA